MPTDVHPDDEIADSGVETRTSPPPPSALAKMVDPVRPGEHVGRFIVLEPLGAGGMGLVWSAFDPKLDRKVALKFLRTEDSSESSQARLLREAQALARLSHPNVVAVHDVETHQGRIFVAMELVVGETMKDWLRQPRSWREILRALIEAGRGLAAAHGAGIIHRDIKPANVLVGTDGRARVSDFGLARPLEALDTASLDAPEPEPALEEVVTKEGHVVGTRAYMSPEQASGKPLDARSDVFSYCVTAYEALCGVRPSALTAHSAHSARLSPPGPGTVPLLPRRSTSKQLARLPQPASGRRPPRRLLKLLARGLQENPELRWPSIPPLLEALERDARPLRPWHLALVGAVVLASTSVAAVKLGQDQCAPGATAISSAWSANDRAWLAPAFAAALPEQPEAAERAARFLDAYAARWQAAYLDACDAMRRRVQAPQIGSLRLACLEARRQEAAAVVDQLRQATAATVKRSSDAVLGMAGVSGCSETEALTAPIAPPDDGPVRQQLDRLHAQLALVSAENAVANPNARADAEALAAEADKVGFAPLQASAQLLLGTVYERIGNPAGARDAFLKALVAAERGHAEVLRGRAASGLAFEVGHYFTRFDEADRWLEVALAIVDRTPMEDVELYVRHVVAQLRVAEGRMPEAMESLDRMEVLLSKQARLDDPIRAIYLSHRSDALFELGRIEESVRYAREAQALVVELRGEQHPVTIRLRYLLARTLVEAGQTVEARDHLDQAVRYWTATGTSNELLLTDAGDMRATSYQMEGRYQEALDEARRVLAMRQRLTGADQADKSFTLDNIGMALLGLGRPAEAIDPLERSLALKTHAGLNLISSAEGALALARALWLSGGDRTRARSLARDAERATRIAPEGRVHREAVAWLAAHQ